jgi:O-antigen ligase
MVFQLALAAGAPLGHAAWGGDHANLAPAQRVGSGLSVVFYLLAIACVQGSARGRRERRYRWGTRALATLMALSALLNLASGSRWETFLLAPIAVVLAVLCVVIAHEAATVSGAPPPATLASR